MSKTALFEVHKELDAKMAPVNGWDMPLFYPGGAVAEHRHCRTAAVIFDGGNRKLWQFTGDVSGLDKNFITPLSAMAPGSAAENILLTDEGRIAACFTVCRMGENDLLAIAAPGCGTPFPGGNELSGALSSFTLLGKKAAEVLGNACEENIPAPGEWKKLTFTDEGENFRAITIAVERFGEPGFEFIFNGEYAADLYDIFYRDTTVAPAGHHAFESLRIEKAVPAWGSELSSSRYPQECAISCTKGTPADAKVRMISAVMPRHPAKPGDKICDPSGNELGAVTGGAYCPSENCAKILGFINISNNIAAGDKIICGGLPATVQ